MKKLPTPVKFIVNPAMFLFGQRLKLVGEIWDDGRPVTYHPDVGDCADPLTRRLKIREVCQQAACKARAKELIKTAVAARSRPLVHREVSSRRLACLGLDVPLVVPTYGPVGGFGF